MSITRIGTYSQIKGSSISLPCRVATTANITLSGTQTIDGISVVAGDRVLVKNQNTGSQNGIYIVSAGAWSRAVDMSLDDDLIQGALIFINSGNLYQGELFILSTAAPMTIGVTALTFTQFTFVNGSSGTAGTSGTNGSSGTSGTKGTSGTSGANGSSGTSGTSGSSGTGGTSGSSGTAGTSGTSGSSGTSGTSGSSGTSGTSGSSGTSGTTGSSGTSGTKGTSGTSGTNGSSGTSGTSGVSGSSGTTGTSGANGSSGTSGTNGVSGSSGTSGTSGVSGANGSSGTSGANGANGSSGTSGANGAAGSSGTSGAGTISGTTNYIAKFTNATTVGDSVMSESGGNITINSGGDLILTPASSGGNATLYNDVGVFESTVSLRLRSQSALILNNSANTNGWQNYTYTDNTLRWNYNGAGNDEIILNSSGYFGIGGDPTSVAFVYITNGNSTYSVPEGYNGPQVYIYNSDNATGTAHSILTLRTNGANSGDPFISMDILGVIGWSMGVDNSDSDKFKIANDWSNIASSTALSIATSTLDATFTSKISATQATFTVSAGTNIELNKSSGPSISFNKTAATAQSWQLSGEEPAFKLYNITASTTPFQISTTGAATFSSSVTATGGFYIPNGVYYYAKRNTGSGDIDILGFASGSDTLRLKGGTSGGNTSIKFADTGGDIAGFYDGNFGVGTITPSFKFTVSGGKSIISSTDNSFGQFQIGNTSSATTSEAAMAFLSGVTAFGTNPTSANGDSYAWVLGAGIYGMNGTTLGIGNKGYGNPILTVSSAGKVAIGRTTSASDVFLGVYSSGSTFTNPVNNDVACVAAINTNNTSTSAHAIVSIRSGGSAGGDAFISLDIANETGFSMGVDNSDSNKFKIANNWSALDSNTRFTMETGGNATFTGTVTSNSGFFDTSDARLKTLIDKQIDYQSILNIEARYYKKGDREELGYFAQDVEPLFNDAVSRNDEGYLNLSYRQVHTAKIAALEKEIRELKAKLNA